LQTFAGREAELPSGAEDKDHKAEGHEVLRSALPAVLIRLQEIINPLSGVQPDRRGDLQLTKRPSAG